MMTPKEVDTQLADLFRSQERAGLRVYNLKQWLASSKISAYSRGEYEKDLAAKEQELRDLDEKIQPLTALFNANPWSRFFLVVTEGEGHVHSSMSCTTCYPTTRYGWLPEMSGKTEVEAVAEFGEKMCTICFPSAPVMVAAQGPSRSQVEKDAKKAEREAKRAANAAKKEAAAIGPLKVPFSSWTIYTWREAKRELKHALEIAGADIPNKDYQEQAKASIPMLADALALKLGGTAQQYIDAARPKVTR